MKNRESRIKEKLNILNPQTLEIIDESHLHAKHYNGDMSDSTHIRIKIKTPMFDKLKLHEQHRKINSLLDDEFKSGLHALSIKILK